jgi:hypothetical protein
VQKMSCNGLNRVAESQACVTMTLGPDAPLFRSSLSAAYLLIEIRHVVSQLLLYVLVCLRDRLTIRHGEGSELDACCLSRYVCTSISFASGGGVQIRDRTVKCIRHDEPIMKFNRAGIMKLTRRPLDTPLLGCGVPAPRAAIVKPEPTYPGTPAFCRVIFSIACVHRFRICKSGVTIPVL